MTNLALPPKLVRVRELLAERDIEAEAWSDADEAARRMLAERDSHRKRIQELDAALAVLTGDKDEPAGKVPPERWRPNVKVKDQVRAWFEGHPNTVAHAKDVATALGKDPNSLCSTLHRLKTQGVLFRPRPGHYQLSTEARIPSAREETE